MKRKKPGTVANQPMRRLPPDLLAIYHRSNRVYVSHPLRGNVEYQGGELVARGLGFRPIREAEEADHHSKPGWGPIFCLLT